MNTHNFYHQRQWYIFWEESWSSCTPWAFLLVLCLSQKRSEVFKMESWCDFLYRHQVFYMYSSLLLQHDPVHPSHGWHQPTLPGPRGAPPPTYTSLHHALLTARPGDAWRLFWEAVSVAPRISVAFRLFRSFRMWYILTLKKNWIFLFIYCTTRAFLCIIFVIFFYI